MTSIIAQSAPQVRCNGWEMLARCARRLSCYAAVLSAALAAAVATDADAATWGCYGTKPGHPTREERFAFIREATQLAVKAERTHGVPAPALTAMAIIESGYGWTRLALQANNLFGWKFASSAPEEGRKQYHPPCRRDRTTGGYETFKSRAQAFDFVAGKLASLEAYREYSEAYQAARKRGDPAEPALRAWLAGIAKSYSSKPDEFVKKVTRTMNNALEPADSVSADYNLYHLSAPDFGG